MEAEKTLEKVESVVPENLDEQIEKLNALGMTVAAEKLVSAKKMKLAYGKYVFISQEKIDTFNKKLMDDSYEKDGRVIRYKQLLFSPLESYKEVPPTFVLDALEKAKGDQIFDTFEVATIDWVRKVEDPILFGIVKGCTDKFFISQWDEDVKIEDLLFMGSEDVKTKG